MADNLLHGDIKKAIHDELGEFITSIDKKFGIWDKGTEALSQAQAEFNELMKRLAEGLKRLDAAEDEAKAQKIIDRINSIVTEEVTEAFTTLVRLQLQLAKDYIFG